MVKVRDLWHLCCVSALNRRVPSLRFDPGLREEPFQLVLWRVVHEFVKHPLKVGKGIVAVAAHLLNEGEDDGTPPSRFFSTNKHPILRAQLRWTDGIFGEVIVPLDPAIFKAGFKVRPLVDGIFEGLAQCAFGKDTVVFLKVFEEFLEVTVDSPKEYLARSFSKFRSSTAVFQPSFKAVNFADL